MGNQVSSLAFQSLSHSRPDSLSDSLTQAPWQQGHLGPVVGQVSSQTTAQVWAWGENGVAWALKLYKIACAGQVCMCQASPFRAHSCSKPGSQLQAPWHPAPPAMVSASSESALATPEAIWGKGQVVPQVGAPGSQPSTGGLARPLARSHTLSLTTLSL